MLILLRFLEGRIHFHSEHRGKSDHQRVRLGCGTIDSRLYPNTVRALSASTVWGTSSLSNLLVGGESFENQVGRSVANSLKLTMSHPGSLA